MLMAVFVRRWELVRVFVLPGMVFTATKLLVTVLHWDRFAVGTGPFNIWFASYLLPPPLFAACWVWQQRRAKFARTRTRIGISARIGSRSGALAT